MSTKLLQQIGGNRVANMGTEQRSELQYLAEAMPSRAIARRRRGAFARDRRPTKCLNLPTGICLLRTRPALADLSQFFSQ